MWTWEGHTFRHVALGSLDRFESDGTRELPDVGSMVATLSNSVSAVSFFGGSHILAEI